MGSISIKLILQYFQTKMALGLKNQAYLDGEKRKSAEKYMALKARSVLKDLRGGHGKKARTKEKVCKHTVSINVLHECTIVRKNNLLSLQKNNYHEKARL